MASLMADILAMTGHDVAVWAPNAAANATNGIDDPAWVSLGAMSAIVTELTPEQAERLAGGPVGVKLATLFVDSDDGATLTIGSLVVTGGGKVWRIDGEPSQPDDGGHYEARLAYESAPPAEVLA